MATSAKVKDKKMSVLFYLGHKASYRTVAHPKGYTHDWHAYVKGKDGYKIEHIVDRVVFRLHESFENPVQEKKKPPYEIRESGYASFAMYIDIYFKDCSEMITYPYDLYLPGEGNPAVSYQKTEKMNFGDKRISSHFRKLLMQAGAIDSDSSSSSSKDEDSSKLKKKDKKKDKAKHKKHEEKTSSRSSSDFSQPQSKQSDPFLKSAAIDSDSNSNSSSSSSSSSPVNNSKPSVSAPSNAHTTQISDLSDSDDEQTSLNKKPPTKRPSTSTTPPEPQRKAKKGAIRASNGLPLEPLLDLHEKIKSLTDVDKLQRVVDLIGESGQFKMNEATFDFDLCQLEADVIKKLKGII